VDVLCLLVVREEEIAALYEMSEAGRGVVVRSRSMRALVKEHELEDQISIRGPGRNQYLIPEGVQTLHAVIQAASQSGGAPRAILLVESDDEPGSVRKMFEKQVGDYGGAFALLQAAEFDQEHEPGTVFDITAPVETAEQNYRASLLLAPLVEHVRERRSQLATGAQKATFLSQIAYDTFLESNLTMRYLADQVPGGRRAPAGIGRQLREDAVFEVAAAAVPVARFGKNTSQAALRSKCAQRLAFCGMSLLPQEPTDKNFLERLVPNPSDDHVNNIRRMEDFRRDTILEVHLRNIQVHLPKE